MIKGFSPSSPGQSLLEISKSKLYLKIKEKEMAEIEQIAEGTLVG